MSWLEESKEYRNRIERSYRDKFPQLNESSIVDEESTGTPDNDGERVEKNIEQFFSKNLDYLKYIYNNPKYIKSLQDKYIKDLNIIEYVKKGFLIKESDGSYSCPVIESTKKMDISKFIKDGRFVIKFNKWSGDFFCNEMELTSLEGSPKEVGGDFHCGSNKLTSLKGAPEYVGGTFNCSFNKLTSLEGAPKYVGETFNCGYNSLISLEGAPEKVSGGFYCIKNNLTSLKGSPQEVGGAFNCNFNKLTSLEGAPEYVGDEFNCSNNNLASLEGAPEFVGSTFSVSNNPLSSSFKVKFKVKKPKGVHGRFLK